METLHIVVQRLFTKVGHHYYSDKQVHVNVNNSVCVSEIEYKRTNLLYGDNRLLLYKRNPDALMQFQKLAKVSPQCTANTKVM